MLRARGGAGYTFGALAILVEAPGRKPSRVRVARSVPVTAIANPPRAVGDVKWLPSRGGEAVGRGPGLAPDGALCWREGHVATQSLPAEELGGRARLGVAGWQERRRVAVPGRRMGPLWRNGVEQAACGRPGDAAGRVVVGLARCRAVLAAGQ